MRGVRGQLPVALRKRSRAQHVLVPAQGRVDPACSDPRAREHVCGRRGRQTRFRGLGEGRCQKDDRHGLSVFQAVRPVGGAGSARAARRRAAGGLHVVAGRTRQTTGVERAARVLATVRAVRRARGARAARRRAAVRFGVVASGARQTAAVEGAAVVLAAVRAVGGAGRARAARRRAAVGLGVVTGRAGQTTAVEGRAAAGGAIGSIR